MALTHEARSARKSFRGKYSKTTVNIVQAIARGKDSSQISTSLGVPVTTVVTTRGNLTRGCYTPYVIVEDQDVVGSCNF